MSKTLSGKPTEQFVWDIEGGLPLLLQDGTASYIYGPGGMVLEQERTADNSAYYYHADQLGSIRLLTGSAGQVVASYNYSAYGFIASATGTITNPFGFAGEYTDPESGMIYLRARYYDPATQQFITRDPIYTSTGEPYGYTGGSPLNGTDPSGLAYKDPGDAGSDAYDTWWFDEYKREHGGRDTFDDSVYGVVSNAIGSYLGYCNSFWKSVFNDPSGFAVALLSGPGMGGGLSPYSVSKPHVRNRSGVGEEGRW